jgi:hypothetical protein
MDVIVLDIMICVIVNITVVNGIVNDVVAIVQILVRFSKSGDIPVFQITDNVTKTISIQRQERHRFYISTIGNIKEYFHLSILSITQ